MDYEWCRIRELVRHAAEGDAEAQTLLIQEIRSHLRELADHYGAPSQRTADFPQQLLARARRDYADFWANDSEFASWIDGVLQREPEDACRRA
jgi:hypothetical protein